MGLAGCGYQFRGGVTTYPPGARTIAVTVFGNRTSEPGVETDFTNSLAFEFNRDRVLHVAAPPADLEATGTIEQLTIQPVAYNKQVLAVERRVWLRVSAKLVSSPTGVTLWEDRSISDNQTYVVDTDPQVTEQNRRDAIARIAARVALQIHDRALEGF